MPNYNEFLKKWSGERKITSFFGSDKPDFLKDWRLAKAGKKFDISKTEFIPLEEAEMDTEPKTKMIVTKKPSEPKQQKSSDGKKRMKRVKDIVKGKYDGVVYYYNRFYDYPEAYGVRNGKVMIIGEVGDYSSLNLFDTPKPVASNVRFYNDDPVNKPIKFLNDLQEK
jgi:hypothetical protein